jgi:pimeloyl-ACP methyl ester carboxylesterase
VRPTREHRLLIREESFRALEWQGREPAVLFLHGLTGVAEAWLPVIARMAGGVRYIAIDQRGHGQSTMSVPPASARALARDAVAAADAFGMERPHLVGHSMGARVAMVAAAEWPDRFRSVAVVDIGPEAWKSNWVETVAALERMDETLEPGRLDAIVERRGYRAEEAAFRARFEALPGGGHRPRGSREAMKIIVRTQRSRNYWREWESITIPLLLVRGGDSDELRPRVAGEMRRRNPGAEYVELSGVGHNIPLLDPDGLAAALSAFWKGVA